MMNKQLIIVEDAAHLAQKGAELFAENAAPLPAQMIAPVAGSLTFILDRPAAAQLPGSNR